MAGLNRVQLIGRLTHDAEVRHTQSGTPVTTARLAVNERFYSKGEVREDVTFINCVIWGKRGSAMSGKELLQKGQALYVEGRLNMRSYENQNGETRYVTEVVVGRDNSSLQLLGSRGGQTPAAQSEPDSPAPRDADTPDDFSDDEE
jgi:single-strand DNA-binding protein